MFALSLKVIFLFFLNQTPKIQSMHDIKLRNKSENSITYVLVGGKNMTEGARIIQPLNCNTFAGGKSITVTFLPGARI